MAWHYGMAWHGLVQCGMVSYDIYIWHDMIHGSGMVVWYGIVWVWYGFLESPNLNILGNF